MHPHMTCANWWLTACVLQAPDSQLSLEEAMSLYGLTHSELFWEKVSDTKMLMAWNRNTVVCAFRGTASISNAWSDLQARLLRFSMNDSRVAASGSCLVLCRVCLCWSVGRQPGAGLDLLGFWITGLLYGAVCNEQLHEHDTLVSMQRHHTDTVSCCHAFAARGYHLCVCMPTALHSFTAHSWHAIHLLTCPQWQQHCMSGKQAMLI